MPSTRSNSRKVDADAPSSAPPSTAANAKIKAAQTSVKQSLIRGRITKPAKQNAITKGGWVLPHGMCSAAASASGQNKDGHDTATTDPKPWSLTTEEAVDTDEGSASSLGLGSSDLDRAANPAALSTLQSSDFVSPITPPEETTETPIKRRRSVRTKVTTYTPAKQEEQISEERGAGLPVDDATVPPKATRTILTKATTTQKKAVVVVKGTTVKDDIAIKTGEEIECDVSQVLDPDFKMRVIRGAENTYGLTVGHSPYPWRKNPTPEACEEVHRILTKLHGEVSQPKKAPAPSLEVAGCGEVPSVLDALLRTLISGNTLMARADAAVKKLAEMYGILQSGIGAGSIDWDKVRIGTLEKAIDAVRPAGCAGVKAAHIKTILDMVFEENMIRAHAHLVASKEGTTTKVPGAANETRGQKALEVESANQHVLSLDHMHSMTKDEAMAEFLRFPGIGVKTAACVILFCLRIPCYAVDTHVHKFSKWLGWVPEKANELDTYNHGEFMVPDHLKYGLHQLFIRHGQQCFKCRKATKPGTDEWKEAPDCPLEHLLVRDKEEATVKPPRKRKMKGEDELDDENSDSQTKQETRRKSKTKRQQREVEDTEEHEGVEGEMEVIDKDEESSEFGE